MGAMNCGNCTDKFLTVSCATRCPLVSARLYSPLVSARYMGSESFYLKQQSPEHWGCASLWRHAY